EGGRVGGVEVEHIGGVAAGELALKLGEVVVERNDFRLHADARVLRREVGEGGGDNWQEGFVPQRVAQLDWLVVSGLGRRGGRRRGGIRRCGLRGRGGCGLGGRRRRAGRRGGGRGAAGREQRSAHQADGGLQRSAARESALVGSGAVNRV